MVSGGAGGRHRAPDGPESATGLDGAGPARRGPPPASSWLESVCLHCAGDGWLPDPDWQAWTEQCRWLQLAAASAAGDVEAAVIREQLRAHEANPPRGPQHHRCGGCSGAGTVPTDAGTQLLDFLHRHGE